MVGRSVSPHAILLALLAYSPTSCIGLHAQSRPNLVTEEEVWANISQANPASGRGLASNTADPTQDLRAFEPAPEPTPASGNQTVSVDELRHPLSRKGQKLIDKIEKELQAGDRSSAMEELNLAVKEPSAAPYAHNILGVEYLKVHKVSEAVDELAQAIALMPGFAAGHSNLGYALCLNGQSEQGFQEIEQALNLDRSSLRAHFLKGVILMDRGAGDHEAWQNLEEAQREVPTAHLALAIFYARHGQSSPAQQQLQDFVQLNPRVTLNQAQDWLNGVAPTGVPAGVALGLWR